MSAKGVGDRMVIPSTFLIILNNIQSIFSSNIILDNSNDKNAYFLFCQLTDFLLFLINLREGTNKKVFFLVVGPLRV